MLNQIIFGKKGHSLIKKSHKNLSILLRAKLKVSLKMYQGSNCILMITKKSYQRGCIFLLISDLTTIVCLNQ